MAGKIVNLTPQKSFNALALVFNGHWNINLLTTKQLDERAIGDCVLAKIC